MENGLGESGYEVVKRKIGIEIDGIDSEKLAEHLWDDQRILTVGIKHPEFEGIRISPSVFTTLEEIDRFADALIAVAENGLPA